jgi:hypothetical protein
LIREKDCLINRVVQRIFVIVFSGDDKVRGIQFHRNIFPDEVGILGKALQKGEAEAEDCDNNNEPFHDT